MKIVNKDLVWFIQVMKIRLRLFFCILFILFSSLFSLCLIYTQKVIIDSYDNTSSVIMRTIILYILIYIMQSLVNMLFDYFSKKFVIYPTKIKLLNMALFSYKSTGLDQQKKESKMFYSDFLTYYIDDIGEGMIDYLNNIRLVFLVISYSVAILLISPLNLVCVILALLIFIVLLNYFSKKFSEVFEKYMTETNKLHSIIEEGITASEWIVSNNAYKWEKNRYLKQFTKYFEESKKLNYFGNLQFGILTCTKWIAILGIVILSSISIEKSITNLSTIIIVYQLSSSIFENFQNYVKNKAFLENFKVKINKFRKMYKKEKYINNENCEINKIELDNLCYQIPSEKSNLFTGINAEIKKGDRCYIIGKSGAGKSTLINLITKENQVYSGKILINDSLIESNDWNKYRKKIGVIYQDSYIFHDTIFNNISMGRTEELNKVIEICKMVGLNDDIINLKNQYNTVIANMGTDLSGGQRQKLLLARTLLGNPDVFILDESTSSIDEEGERLIYKLFDKLNKDKIFIIVSHRNNMIANNDMTIKL